MSATPDEDIFDIYSDDNDDIYISDICSSDLLRIEDY